MTLGNGNLMASPRWNRTAQKRLRRAQCKAARRIKGSSGRHKAVRQLRSMHKRIANQRSDFVHKLSRRITRGYQLIAVKRLNVDGMSKGMLAKQLHDAASWRFFLNQRTVKAAEVDGKWRK